MNGPPHGLPPYTEVVFLEDAQRELGPTGVGLLVWFLSHAYPTGDGAWVVTGKVRDLARQVAWSYERFDKTLRDLLDAGYITRQDGQRFGKAGGSTPRTYFLTHHPNMLGPTGPERGSRNTNPYDTNPYGANPNPTNSYRTNSKHPHPQRPHLRPVGEHETASAVRRTQNPAHPVVVDELSQQQTGMLLASGKSERPAYVQRALDDIGYDGPLPPEEDLPHDVLVALARHVARQEGIRNPAGLLRTWLRIPGKAIEVARVYGLIPRSPSLDAFGREMDDNNAMPLNLFERLSIEFPEWAEAVTQETTRQVQATPGARFTMLLKRQVAATIPHQVAAT